MSDRRNAVHGATRFTASIERIDEEQRLVWGYASTTALAADGKVLTIDAMKNALDDYMAFANVREMHQLWAAGVTKEATVDDKGMFVCVHVVDDAAWEKVKSGVYKAFSIGAKVLSIIGNVIHSIVINEISLVDRPSDPEALFTMWRAATSQEQNMTKPLAFNVDEPAAAAPAAAPATADGGAVQRAEGEGGAEDEPAAAVEAPAAEDVERAEAAAVEEPVAAPADAGDAADPLSETARASFNAALASVEAIERARGIEPELTRTLPGGDLRRSFYDVRALSCILCDLAYYVYDANWTAKVNDSASPVPNALRAALAALAEAYKALTDEELTALLSSAGVGDVQRALAFIDIAAKSDDVTQLDDAQKADLQRALDAFVKRGFPLPAGEATAADNEELTRVKAELETANGKVTKLEGTVGELNTGLQDLNRRLTALANEPAPPKAAASPLARAVGKVEDVNAPAADVPDGSMTQAEFDAALAQLTPLERAKVLMQRALGHGVNIPTSAIAPRLPAPAESETA